MEKVARICWNTEGWRRPSGKEGKSNVLNTYEKKTGYGHEEWLLDTSKVIDGYHYAFLEPMNVKSDKHIGKTYDIHLFAISPSKQRVYIGCLHKAVGVSREEADSVFEIYQEKGWLDEMKEDIRFVGGKITDFDSQWLFNVKFKFEDAEINIANPSILDPDSLGHRYNLMDKKGDFEFVLDENGDAKTLDTSEILRTTREGEVLIDPRHKKIQNAIVKQLKKEYSNIKVETVVKSLSSGQRIDVIGTTKATDEIHYFEVKTGSARQSIREALGQILEYSHYNHKSTRASKLFIVGPEKPDKYDVAYIQKLREMYNLPVYFRWFSFEDGKLYEAI